MLLKNKYNQTTSFISVGILAVLFSFIIIYFKYEFNQISITDFRLDYIGNILNLLIGFLIFLASIILKFSKKNIPQSKKIIAIGLITISFFLLSTLLFVDKIKLFHTTKLIFNIPIHKFYLGLSFSVAVAINIYILIYLWGFFFETDKLYELRVLIRTFLALMILIIFSLLYVWNVGVYSEENLTHKNFEYGCIPGAAVWSKGKPSPIFEGRIRKALSLYRKKIIKKIIVTGGNAPGEISEAEAAAKFLINLGVDKKNIIVENHSSTTTEQIKFLKNNFQDKEILVISDGFHLSRITQIAKFFNLKAQGVYSEHSLSFEKTIYYRTRESIAVLMFWLFAI